MLAQPTALWCTLLRTACRMSADVNTEQFHAGHGAVGCGVMLPPRGGNCVWPSGLVLEWSG